LALEFWCFTWRVDNRLATGAPEQGGIVARRGNNNRPKMGLYSRIIFPRLCELALSQPMVAAHRRELLTAARGTILEIGFGTGLNLAHYPDHVRAITAIDPNPGMHRKAQSRIKATGLAVDKRLLGSEQLPFDSDCFDCVVSTFTLCSIAEVDRALAEIHRVLKPGGQFLFLEHGLSPDAGVQKWQRRLNRLERLLADNCHLDRNIRELVVQNTYQSLEVKEFYLEKIPRTHGYISQGVATK
jgi:ubiquinone/menaquinone biosynthesis C-methylase UbiE